MKILIVEDDFDTLDGVTRSLQALGHTVDQAKNGREGLEIARQWPYDVIILDRMLPGMDGLTVLEKLRASGSKSPVLFLTALNSLTERVLGLDSGADDYLIKPFAFSELAARVHALGRRPALNDSEPVLRICDLEMDLRRRRVRRDGKVLDLRPVEFKLLEYLMRNASQVVTRTMLLEHVWGIGLDPRTKMIETNMSRLRTKVDKGFDPPLIHTVRSAGYSLHADD